ncbi:methyltransferase domain-containing protein [Streptomyces tailanensis]|uniref:methyltransferase domain-containing protein n=1 Tax=Streptomyces tailanensis TaxID=2569858 RepID=UPI00122E11ED|nr:methyltransferase domain-containing protein [Streptomyces tailanensis]
MTRTDGYLFDQQQTGTGQAETGQAEMGQAETGQRSEAFATLFDPTTFRHMEGFGLGSGWRCWEVGAGCSSVVSWLAKKVGPTGKVMATDTDLSWAVPSVTRPPVEVRVHHVGIDQPPDEGFDFVHARLALGQAPDRERALLSMIHALRPGGRILIEDADPALQPLACPEETGPEHQLANRLRQVVRTLLAERGVDPAHGRRLPRLLRAAGLRGVGADAYFPVASPDCAALELTTIQQLRAALVAANLATDEEIDRHLADVASGTMDVAAPPLISAWGRKA